MRRRILLAAAALAACDHNCDGGTPLESWCSQVAEHCEPLSETLQPSFADQYLFYECGGLLVMREYDRKDGVQYDNFYDPATADPVAATLGELVGMTITYDVYDNCRVSVYGEVPDACRDYRGPFVCGYAPSQPDIRVHTCPD